MSRLAAAVQALLQATEEELSGSEYEAVAHTPGSVRDLLRAGEPVVAFEILCDNLYEIDVRPDRNLVQSLRREVVDVGADSRRVDLLIS